MILPNFICIGAQRAGTTWLHRMLLSHPGIYLPAQKELHYFDEKPDFSDYQGLGKKWMGKRPYYDMNDRADWLWYQEQFKAGWDHKIRGEITPFYATLSDQRVACMADKLSALKLIYIIRNPIKRAWSNFRYLCLKEGIGSPSELDGQAMCDTIMHPQQLRHGEYRRNITIYESHFQPDRILYLFYDDIVQKPAEVISQVYSYLGAANISLPVELMKTKINSAPSGEMPAGIAAELAAYYAEQFAFVQDKFKRGLEH
ncbi:MAG: sulfotransferase [Candidatus Margulisiibacteriota bacterium]